MSASIAVEARGGLERMHHEAKAGACLEDGITVLTGAARRGVGHLCWDEGRD